jgi:hypothetical protein
MSTWTTYEIGQEGPFKKKIKEIIFQSDTFIVYMDEKDTIQWFAQHSGVLHESFGEIQNKVSDWESKANKLFKKEDAYDIKTILAEAYARILDDKNIFLARDIIDRAIERIKIQGAELLKQYYSIASLIATLLILLVILFTKLNKGYFINSIGRDEYDIWMTMLFGGIGAFIFTIIKLKDYRPDILISKFFHFLDGVLRIFYGTIGGLVIAIAIKSNLVFGFLNNIDKTIYVSAFIGICAGASEAIIPSLIKQLEAKSTSNSANHES